MHTYVEIPFDISQHIVCLDCETTGLDPFSGDRVVEIGMVELLGGRPTGRALHHYVNPTRKVPAEATKIHGLDNAFLADKPIFSSIADEVRDFVSGAIVVIQNAPFDLGFLNMELAQCGRGSLPCKMVLDTLELSKREGVAKRHTLDAMCDRFGVDRNRRTHHGALLDAELLGEVFLAMARDKSPLNIVSRAPIAALLSGESQKASLQIDRVAASIAAGMVRLTASDEELAAHLVYMEGMSKSNGGNNVWAIAQS